MFVVWRIFLCVLYVFFVWFSRKERNEKPNTSHNGVCMMAKGSINLREPNVR